MTSLGADAAERPVNVFQRFVGLRPLEGIAAALIVLYLLLASQSGFSPRLTHFDPVLMTREAQGGISTPGSLEVSDRGITLSTAPRSRPTVHLLTSDGPFTAEFDVSVVERWGHGGFPFQVKVWNPRDEVAVEGWYDSEGGISIAARERSEWRSPRRVASYKLGQVARWRVRRATDRLVMEVHHQGQRAEFVVDRAAFPALFDAESLSLTIYGTGMSQGAARAHISRPVVSVLPEWGYGTLVDDQRARIALTAATLASLLWLARWMGGRRVSLRPRFLLLAGMAGLGLLLLASWPMLHLPGHPIDARSHVVWSHLADEYGPALVPAYSMLATPGEAFGGQPYAPVTYPYPPLLLYVFWIAGAIGPAADMLIRLKLLNLAGVAAGGGILIWLLTRLGVPRVHTLVSAGAYALNPAVLFDSAVWGQTDAYVAAFLLLSASGVALRSGVLFWVGAALAALTKQTGMMFLPLLLLLAVRQIGIGRILGAFIPALLIVFLILSPLFLSGLDPAALYRPAVTKLLAFGTIRHMEVINAVVSQGSFTLWTMLAGLQGAHGWERLAYPDFVPTRFGATYFLLSRVIFMAFVGLLMMMLLRRRSEKSPVLVFLAMAAYGVAVAVLLTRVQPRYLYFAIPFAAASLPWISRKVGIMLLGAISGTMLVAMWGVLAATSMWYPEVLPVFDPARFWLNGAAARTLGSDLGINVGGLVTMLSLAGLTLLLWRQGRSQMRARRDSRGRPLIDGSVAFHNPSILQVM